MGHPAPGPDGAAADPRSAGQPVLHLGPVAAGRGVALDDSLRQEFAYVNGVLCNEGEDKLCHILLFPRVIQNLHT